MGEAWASTSHCDLTDKRLGAEKVPAPKGTPNPWSGTGKGHRGPRPLSDPPLHLNTTSPNHQQQQGPPPHQLPLQGPSAQWRPAGGAKPPSPALAHTWLRLRFLARGPSLVCASFHLLFRTVKK